MESIKFSNLEMDSQRFSVVVTDDAGTYPLFFSWNKSLSVTTPDIAVAMSTLCGRNYRTIRFNFPINDQIRYWVERFTGSEIEAPRDHTIESARSDDGLTLSFSGGFDSLAARALMPRQTRLVSLDLGGRFSREGKFFEKFDPLIVSTNLLDTPLRKNSWTFMAIPAILSNRTFGSRFHTFGSILEANPDAFRSLTASDAQQTPIPLKMAGFTSAQFVAGLSEIGTLIVLLQSDPALIADALRSLASPGEEKLHRKAMLTKAVASRMNVKIDLPEIISPKTPHFAFGEQFAVDVTSLYVLWVLGRDVAATMVRDIPVEVESQIQSSGLDVLEKWHPGQYVDFPQSLAGRLAYALADFGIQPYAESDWNQLDSLRKALYKHL